MSGLEHDLALISEALDESIPWIPSEFDNAGVCLARDGRNALDRLRSNLAAAQAKITALEQALATCGGTLERIDAEAQRCRRIQGGPAIPETDAGRSYGYGKIVIDAREARAAAKAALDE